MAEASASFVLHPSVFVSALLAISPHAALADRLLGEVGTGRATATVVDSMALLEFHVLNALVATQVLVNSLGEDLMNILSDLRRLLTETNRSGHLQTEPFEPYRLTSAAVAWRHGLELYTASLLMVAVVKHLPLVVADEPLYGQLQRVVLTARGLQVMRLQEFV